MNYKILAVVVLAGVLLQSTTVMCQTPSYNYAQQGADWTGTCATGKQQTPIDVKTSTLQCARDFVFEWEPKRITLSNVAILSTTKLAYHSDGDWSKLRATVLQRNSPYSFTAIQFHMHAKSEHTVDGGYYPLELHIVHTLDPNQNNPPTRTLAVVGIFFEEVPDTFSGDTFFDYYALQRDMSTNPPVATTDDLNIKVALFGQKDFTSANLDIYAYEGSLTTPGCDELVNWYIIRRSFPIRSAQLAKLNVFLKSQNPVGSTDGNYRKIQPLNDRTVYWVGNGCQATVAATSASTLIPAFAALIALLLALL